MRDLTIKKKTNGFQVNIGCMELVFETRKKLFKELSRYIANPDEVEKEYVKKYGREQHGIQYNANDGAWRIGRLNASELRL